MKYLRKIDPVIYGLVKKEEKRQEETLMMIPSENTASYAVEEAVGTALNNKYAEGYPLKRYYQGQGVVDQVELLAIDRAKKLFKVEDVNVQPYSGSPANFAVYTALLSPKDTIMGLVLASGGHLTHGAAVSSAAKYFHSVQYNVNEKGLIDYDELLKQAKKEKPKLIVAGTTAYARVLDWKKFARIADEVGAYLMADIAHVAGLIAAEVYPSPVPYAHVITTTTHKTLRGPRGAMIMVTKRGIKKDPDIMTKINKAVFPGVQGGPHINTIAGIAVALKEASTARFKTYAKRIIDNASTLALELTKRGFTLVTGGTDSHLILMDLSNKNMGGKVAAEALEEVGIVLNYNTVPYDKKPPFNPSGLRLGTPGVTSRGMGKTEMKIIASVIEKTVEAVSESKKRLKIEVSEEKLKVNRVAIIKGSRGLAALKKQIQALCKKYPLKKVY